MNPKDVASILFSVLRYRPAVPQPKTPFKPPESNYSFLLLFTPAGRTSTNPQHPASRGPPELRTSVLSMQHQSSPLPPLRHPQPLPPYPRLYRLFPRRGPADLGRDCGCCFIAAVTDIRFPPPGDALLPARANGGSNGPENCFRIWLRRSCECSNWNPSPDPPTSCGPEGLRGDSRLDSRISGRTRAWEEDTVERSEESSVMRPGGAGRASSPPERSAKLSPDAEVWELPDCRRVGKWFNKIAQCSFCLYIQKANSF